MDCSIPGFPVLHYLPEYVQTDVHWIGDTMKPSHPLSSSSPPAFNLSSIKVFCNKSALCSRWPKYWSFSFSTIPFNEYSGLISFRNDWLKLLAVQGTLKSLLQHHSLTASILHCSAFFTVQLTSTHDYWKKYNFDYMNLCQQSDVCGFLICCLFFFLICCLGMPWLFSQGASVF